MHAPALILLLVPGGAWAAELMSPLTLQAQVEAFAGQSALVDPRLMLPVCGRPEIGWAPGGRSVMVHCPAPEWRVFVPVGGATAAPVAAVGPVIRRGDRVTVEAGGNGFVIGMEAVAEADAREGRVALRSVDGGRRLYGFVDDGGRVTIRGLNPMVNGR